MTDQTPTNDVPSEQGQPPVPPAATNQPPQPLPGTPIPPKKGLPGWALGLIIGGGVLLLAIIGVVILVVVLTVGAASRIATAPDIEWPTATEAPTDAGTDPGDSTTPSGSIPLSAAADFGGAPVWGAPYLTGWDITVLDQNGVNRFENATLGCSFTTSQNMQSVDPSSSSDAPTTQSLMDSLKKQIVSTAPNAVVSKEDSVDISIGSSGSSSTIEFATMRMDYQLSSGDYSSVLFSRSMPNSGSYMYGQVECSSATIDGADSPLTAILEQIAVVPSP